MINEFIAKYNNGWWDFDGVYGYQCKDLFSFFNRDVVKNPDYVWGDAWKLYDNAPDKYYEKIINTASFVPQKGDWCIWEQSYGGYGHVGMVIGATDRNMQIMSQNYKGNQEKTQITTYGYSKVKGFLRTKGAKVAGQLYNNSAGQVWMSFDNKKFYVENASSIQGEPIINGDAPGEIMIKQSDQDARLAEQKAEYEKKIEALSTDLVMCEDTVDEMAAENKENTKELDMCKVMLERGKAGSHGPVVPSVGIWERLVAWVKNIFKSK